MKNIFVILFILTSTQVISQVSSKGMFSLGTRNTISTFQEIKAEKTGVGIGGQFRIQFSDKINTEWYADWITSEIGSKIKRNDYHIGWSVMYYFTNQPGFKKFLKPYLIVGHCFDNSVIFEAGEKSNQASRLSMATQAGIGTHFNFSERLDCSVSGQYMLHFGRDFKISEDSENVVLQTVDHSHAGGHLLWTISFNYKFFNLWKSKA